MEIIIALLDIIIWPVVIIFALLFFKKPISEFFGRMKTVNALGVSVTATQPKDTTGATPTSAENLLKAFDNVLLSKFEALIIEDLEKQDLESKSDSAKVLVRYLAATQIAYGFELIDKSIYGSQISLLQHLNSLSNGDTKENLRIFYNNAAATWTDTYRNYTYDQYFEFLINLNLIIKTNTNHNLTQVGIEFLSYLAYTGNTGFRAY